MSIGLCRKITSLCAAVTICSTLVNIQTDTQTDRQHSQPAELKCGTCGVDWGAFVVGGITYLVGVLDQAGGGVAGHVISGGGGSCVERAGWTDGVKCRHDPCQSEEAATGPDW